MEMAFAAMMGWCGTKWPGWWRGPKPPQPDPWWLISGIIGAVAGVVAVGLFRDTIGDAGIVGLGVATFFAGVFAGSAVDSVMNLVGGSRGGPAA